ITLDEVQPLTLPFDRLRAFKIHKLRLGSQLIEDMLENPDSATVVGTLVELGHQLGLTVLADGVGNGRQVRYLRGLGCDQAQGDYFSLALPAEELHLLLCQRRQVA
ncbi:MAG: EAL domain-containing protein, partial [Candidatus Competibacteraceae bacterium]|nr:EAL domain-containing protein [Candidatus Competibacteraceae bacterium]